MKTEVRMDIIQGKNFKYNKFPCEYFKMAISGKKIF